MRDPNDLVYLPALDGYNKWSNVISKVRTRDASTGIISKSYSIEPLVAKTTTYEPCIVIPSEYYN